MSNTMTSEPPPATDVGIAQDQGLVIRLPVDAQKILAQTLFEAQRHEQARAVCREILKQRPGDADALRILSQCRFDVGDFLISGPPAGAPDRHGVNRDAVQTLEELNHSLGFRGLQRLGFHVQRNDYYSPLNDCDFLEKHPGLWRDNPDPAEIDWRLEAQLKVAGEISRFAAELRGVPDLPPLDGSHFAWNNNFWNNADAIAQYGLVRSRKPRRYVEVGCGWSSLLLKEEMDRNHNAGAPAEVTLVEPYPNPNLFQHLPAQWQVHRVMLQQAPLDIFDSLKAGDFLFYDGSHCAKAASDVNWFFFRLLPRLQPGVIIHLHDIHLPEDYADDVIFTRGQTWNEQYVLQAFLMHNAAYRILLANRYLFHRRTGALEQMCQGVQPAVGCSFWMEKIMPAAQNGALPTRPKTRKAR